MYSIYGIYNKKHNKIYIGQCSDLGERLKMHNEKIFPRCYTAKFDGNWILIYSEQIETRAESLKREKQLKSYRGREFIKNFIPR
jgi:putative endonuclease